MSDRTPGQRFASQATPSPVPAPDQGSSPGTGPALTPQRYRARAPLVGLLAAALALILAVVLVWAGTRPATPGQATTSQQTQATSPTGPTPSPGWQGIEFAPTGSSITGYWQISAPTWAGTATLTTVTLTTTLTVDHGTLNFAFFALDNKAANYYDTSAGSLQTGTLSTGQSRTGTLVFEMPRGDFTLYLANGTLRSQITALLVKA